MKKLRYVVLFGLAVVLVASLVLSGSAPTAASPKEEWPKALVWMFPRLGGTPYLAGSYFAGRFQNDHKITSTLSLGLVKALKLLKEKKVDFTPQATEPGYTASLGIKSFADFGPVPNVRYVALWYSLAYQLVVPARSNIRSPRDLKGKKFAWHHLGTPWVAELGEVMMEYYGLTGNVTTVKYSTADEGVRLLKDGIVEAHGIGCSGGNPRMRELSQAIPVRFISFDKEAISYVVKKCPWSPPTTIAANTYKGQKERIDTFGPAYGLYCRAGLPDSLVYEVCKYSYGEKYRADFAALHRLLAAATVQRGATTGMPVPYHPGAIKFYKEAGVWTKEMDKINGQLLKEMEKAARK